MILHQHFKVPQRGGAIRSYYLAKALAERGHQVVVLTGHNGPFKKEVLEGIEVNWLPIAYDNRFGFSARSISFLKYVWAVIRRPALVRGADLCYTISVPLTIGLAAMWIKRWFRVPYIFEVGDLWPDAPIQMGFIRNKLFKAFLYDFERRIYRGAQAIVALSVPIKKAIEPRASGKRVYVIPNMADMQFYNPVVKGAALQKQFGVEGRFVVSYVGAVGLANGLDYFVECARASERAGLPVHFLLCGDGAMLESLKTAVKRLQLTSFTFVPFRDREGVKQVLDVSDAVFVCYKPVPILETGSPNKYFDGLAAGKLILVNFGGWIKKEIEENRCGVYLDATRPTSFVAALEPFIKDHNLLQQYQVAARALAGRNYSREKLGEQFAAIVKNA